MGYLNNSTIVIDAILTTTGRALLAAGSGFNITQFAVADDEVDYGLWNTAHPLGTAFYGSAIESLPLLEASPDPTQCLRYKLVTLPRGTQQIPIIQLGFSNIVLTAGQLNAFTITPSTAGGFNGPGFGYTAILFDGTSAVLTGTGLPTNNAPTVPGLLGDTLSSNAVTAVGTTFTLTPKNVPSQIITQLTVLGNESGAATTVPVTINPQPTT